MKKGLCFALVLILSISLSGCWDYSPLENNYTIVGLGIDVDETSPGDILVSFVGPAQTSSKNSSSSGTSDSKSPNDSCYYVKASGESIRSAATQAQNKTGQTLSINNLRVIVFSEDMAKKGIAKYLDAFVRNAQIHPNAFIFVTRGTAKDLLSFQSKNISRTPLYLIDLIRSSEAKIKTDYCTLKEVAYALNSNDKAFVLPYFVLDPKEKEITSTEVCLFREDKLVSIFSESETIGYMLLSGIMKRDEYVIDRVHTDNKEKSGSSFHLSVSRKKVNVSKTNNRIRFDLAFKLTAETTELSTNSTMMNSQAPDVMNGFDSLQKANENAISSLLKSSIVTVLEKLQSEYKADSLGFGEYVRVKYPDYYKKISWPDEFEKAEFHVNVEVELKSSGIIK